MQGPSQTKVSAATIAPDEAVADGSVTSVRNWPKFSSSTPSANPRQPAWAAATTRPPAWANNTGRQSATRIVQTTPAVRVQQASASMAPASDGPDSSTDRQPWTWLR